VLVFEIPLLAKEYGLPFREISKYLIFWITGFSLFAFLLNLTREIVKDAQDFEGDQAYGKSTIPVAWGTKAARYISVIILISTIALLLIAWTGFIRDTVTIIYFCLMIVIPLLFVIFRLLTDDSEAGYRIVNIVLKIVMITGLGYAVAANLILNNMMR
jgi:4-hydroxybenzoate polyprenyltransferase